MILDTQKRKKIVIVDDEEDITEFLSYQFRKNGYEVFAHQDGLAALSSAFKELPDIILSDIRMPVMDGIEMCKTIKSDPLLCEIPVLFLTADDSDYLALLAHQCGADFYLNKPLKIDLILKVVNSILEQKTLN